nr:hypothetical protein [Tanacetum cinerariifolium]
NAAAAIQADGATSPDNQRRGDEAFTGVTASTHSAEDIGSDLPGECIGIRALTDHFDGLEIPHIGRDFRRQSSTDRMMAVGVVMKNGHHFFGRRIQGVCLKSLGDFFRVFDRIVVGFQNRLRQGSHYALFVPGQLAGDAHHAAAEIGVLLHQIGRQLP